jgi:hypothetical protein
MKPLLTREELFEIWRNAATPSVTFDAIWTRILEDRERLFEIGEQVEVEDCGAWKPAEIVAFVKNSCSWRTVPEQVRHISRVRPMTDKELIYALTRKAMIPSALSRSTLEAIAKDLGIEPTVEVE